MASPADRLRELFQKYRYALAVVLAGILLMVLPSSRKPAKSQPPETGAVLQETSLEDQLEALLSSVEGAGRVHLLLTQQYGPETAYQTDTSRDSQEQNSRENANTVLVEDAARNETGLVRRISAPVYRGAVVVCQGGDLPQVRLHITEAVRRLTGLRADQISVLKMK